MWQNKGGGWSAPSVMLVNDDDEVPAYQSHVLICCCCCCCRVSKVLLLLPRVRAFSRPVSPRFLPVPFSVRRGGAQRHLRSQRSPHGRTASPSSSTVPKSSPPESVASHRPSGRWREPMMRDDHSPPTMKLRLEHEAYPCPVASLRSPKRRLRGSLRAFPSRALHLSHSPFVRQVLPFPCAGSASAE